MFEVADLAYVVSDGRLSEPIIVMRHEDVESLALAITRLERHARGSKAEAPSSDSVEPGDGEGAER